MEKVKKWIIVCTTVLLAGTLCTGCFKENPLDVAVERWQTAIHEGDMNPIWDDLYSATADDTQYTKREKKECMEWYAAEMAAFDGTPLEQYMTRARESVTISIEDHHSINLEGFKIDVANIVIQGDAFGCAIRDWLQDARSRMTAYVLENDPYVDAKIIHDTMKGIDSVYGQAGSYAFQNFEDYYQERAGDLHGKMELSVYRYEEYIQYDCGAYNAHNALQEALCGFIHVGSAQDAEHVRMIEWGYAVSKEDLDISYADIMREEYNQSFVFAEDE